MSTIPFHLGTVHRVYTDNRGGKGSEKSNTNMIKLKGLDSPLPTVAKEQFARPLFRGVHDSITKGDLVLFCILPHRKVYYIGPLNSFNNPNYSPNPTYSKIKQYRGIDHNIALDGLGYSELYPRILTKPLNKTYSRDLDLDFIIEDRGDLINTTAVEHARFSDLVFDGRHGNSIRIGSRAVNPILTIHNNRLSSEVETLSQGSVVSMMSVGSIEQNFMEYGFRLSIDTDRDEEDNFKLNGGNISGEDSYDYNYSLVNPDEADEEDRVDFDQMIIFSDRITFDARSQNAGDFTVSANRNINFGARKNFTLNNKGFSVINSGNIYLGKKAKDKTQPMVLGEKLRELLEQIVQVLNNANALVQGVPLPLVDSAGISLKDTKVTKNITEILEQLEERTLNDEEIIQNDGPQFMSHHHYIEQNNSRS